MPLSFNMRFVRLLALLAAPLHVADGDSGACTSDTSEVAQLYVLTVNHTDSLGWLLECDDGNRLWDVPVGAMADTEAEVWLSRGSCVEKNATCHFKIASVGHTFYSLTYGDAPVAFSNDRDVTETESVYCFGPRCSENPVIEPDKEEVSENRAKEEKGKQGNSWSWKTFIICIIVLLLLGTFPLCFLCWRLFHFRVAQAAEGDTKAVQGENESDRSPTLVSPLGILAPEHDTGESSNYDTNQDTDTSGSLSQTSENALENSSFWDVVVIGWDSWVRQFADSTTERER